MNALDLVLLAAAVLVVVGGWRLGFTTRVLSWVGLGVGVVVALRLLPWLLGAIDGSDHRRVALVTIATVVVGAALGQMAGYALGARLAPVATHRRLVAADRAMGAVAGLVGLVVMAWLVLPVLAVSPGWPADLADGSLVARTLSDHLPEPPDASQALRALVGSDNFPQVFAALQPTPQAGPPPAASGIDDATAARVARSVLKIEGQACRRIQDGTGFVIGDGLVVTNAHVVAGESTTTVQRDDGRRLSATVVAFDPERDLALLQVPRLDRPALAVTKARAGTVGGVFGHPGGEPLRIAPFEVSRQIEATGRDIYDQHTTDRQVLELAAALRPGDSGSPLIDPAGEVVGVAFAISTDHPQVAYALATSELDTFLATAGRTPVSAGGCVS